MLKKNIFLIFVAAAITASGCSTNDESRVKSETAITPVVINVLRIQVKPYSIRITAGHFAKFKVEGIDAAGKKIHLSASWKLTDNNADTGSLDRAAGEEVIFTAITPGSLTLVAEYNNHIAKAAIEVVKRQ